MDLSQEEIIARFEELLSLPVQDTIKKASELKSGFYFLNNQRLQAQKREHRDLGAKMEDFIPASNPLEERFKKLFSVYRDNKAKYLHLKHESEQKNLTEKKEVLKELTTLIDNEENIGKSFHRFKDLQDKWRDIGPVPGSEMASLVAAYKAEVDRFYYNISINKELKEYDLSKNLEIRNTIVDKLEELQQETKISDIELILSAAKEEWEEAGPVKPEAFVELRKRYFEAVRSLHKKIQHFYSERKEKMEGNLEEKLKLVARATEIASAEFSSSGQWNKAKEELSDLRTEWNKIGPVERKANNRAWEQFKTPLDSFFSKLRAFHGEAREQYKENRTAKEHLISEAEKFAESSDWKQTTQAFIRLQNDWKKIGFAGSRWDAKLWKRFREVCDGFFNRKKEFFDTMNDRETENLKVKEDLLEKMSKLKLQGDDNEKKTSIKQMNDEWVAIGNVPRDKVKQISTAFHKAIDSLYGQLDLDRVSVDKLKFKSKVQRMTVGRDGADRLRKETQFIRKKLNEKQDELRKYENNMAFFKHAKPDNPLMLNALKNMDDMKTEIASLTEKLKLINTARNSN